MKLTNFFFAETFIINLIFLVCTSRVQDLLRLNAEVLKSVGIVLSWVFIILIVVELKKITCLFPNTTLKGNRFLLIFLTLKLLFENEVNILLLLFFIRWSAFLFFTFRVTYFLDNGILIFAGFASHKSQEFHRFLFIIIGFVNYDFRLPEFRSFLNVQLFSDKVVHYIFKFGLWFWNFRW